MAQFPMLAATLADGAALVIAASQPVVVYALRPEARARLNTLFMGMMFLGGAIGSGAATLSWTLGGWNAVSGLGVLLAAAATFLQRSGLRRSR